LVDASGLFMFMLSGDQEILSKRSCWSCWWTTTLYQEWLYRM